MPNLGVRVGGCLLKYLWPQETTSVVAWIENLMWTAKLRSVGGDKVARATSRSVWCERHPIAWCWCRP